jgi:AcrR family transcriptional regulator
MSVKSARSNSRDAILDAAEAVVLQSGGAHLTLDAVAARARVSKGGLLYHFPSKDSLLEGMLSRCVQRFARDAAAAAADYRRSPAADLKGLVQASCDDQGTSRQVNAAMLAAVANNPKLLQPVLVANREVFTKLGRRKGHFARAAAVVLATKGLWLMETLEVCPLTPRQRKQVVEELLNLAEEAG